MSLRFPWSRSSDATHPDFEEDDFGSTLLESNYLDEVEDLRKDDEAELKWLTSFGKDNVPGISVPSKALLPVVLAGMTARQIKQAARKGTPYPGAPDDVTREENLSLWKIASGHPLSLDAPSTIDAHAFIAGLMGLTSLGIAITAFFADSWGGSIALGLVSAFTGGVSILAMNYIRIEVKRRGSQLSAERIKHNLNKRGVSFPLALQMMLVYLEAGSEAKLLTELGPADLVALSRMRDDILASPTNIPISLSGERRELTCRVLDCLGVTQEAIRCFEPPVTIPVKI